MPAGVFTAALAGLGDSVSVTELQIDSPTAAPPRTDSERALREYVGDPAHIVAAVACHDALLVHGAPVSAEVLDAAPLRLVCCARGGPVNVDVAAASMTLGLVGLGNVGREVAARGRTLGFTMLGYDPVRPTIVPPGVTMVTLDDLLSRSELISLHARATPDNRHLLGAAAFARMPRGAFFINTARESLVDEDALAAALASGTLAGAALDVVERRPAGDRHPLLDLPNVIITPHIGGATRETLRRGAEMAAAAVARLVAGQLPDHLMNPEILAREQGGP